MAHGLRLIWQLVKKKLVILFGLVHLSFELTSYLLRIGKIKVKSRQIEKEKEKRRNCQELLFGHIN